MRDFEADAPHGPERRQPVAGEGHPAHGSGELVSGWYRALKRQLGRLEPYLVPGRLVTFQQVNPEEKDFFEWLNQAVRVPETVCAVFIPPSVVQQAIWPLVAGSAADQDTGLYSIAPDAGAVAAQRCGASKTIVNALFAFPPLAPGIDVYEDGRLLAGYTQKNQTACAQELTDVLATYLD
jgi:hypothetical protein